MIAWLTGRLQHKAADYLILDVAGVGYQVFVPLSTYYSIPDSDIISLHIHTHVREDSLVLFGFLTQPEKDLFLLLMGVSGIGPKLALAVLSSLSVPEIAAAIQTSDEPRLCAIPGVGRKTAARMVLELKEKISAITPVEKQHELVIAKSRDMDDAVSALLNLGYKRPLAEEAIKQVMQSKPGLTVEALIRLALTVLMRK